MKKQTWAVASCTCPSPYQDQRYGHGNRAHNICQRGRRAGKLRCTVCGVVKEAQPARAGD